MLWSIGRCAAEVPGKTENLDVTPSLVREIQFMLLRLGMEPGPIDGVIGPQTTAAWRKFQQDTGLPPVDLVNGSKIPATELDAPAHAKRPGSSSRARESRSRPPQPRRRRRQRSRRYSRLPRRPIVSPHAPSMPKISGSARPQYTPEKYLQEGFDGSTARAVSMLKDRLNEARQIAGNIGGAALTEVQRQSRVLDYFTCRLKIEQASQK